MDHDVSPGAVFMTKVYDITLGVAAASIDTGANVIPQEFTDLRLVYSLRDTIAATNVSVVLRFNNDSGANYYSQVTRFSAATTVGGVESLGITSGRVGAYPGASSTASEFGSGQIVVPCYSFTDRHKTWSSHDAHADALTSGNIVTSLGGGSWQSTAAINQFAVFSTGTALRSAPVWRSTSPDALDGFRR